MNACELTSLITAVANIIASNYSVDELSLLSSMLVQLSDTLATIASQRTLCDENKTLSLFKNE